MKNPKLRILNYVIPLITLLVSIVCYFRLPDQITLSWDLNGAASYEAKWHLFLMSGMGLVIAILFDILPHVDPRKKNYSKFEHFYRSVLYFYAALSIRHDRRHSGGEFPSGNCQYSTGNYDRHRYSVPLYWK